MLRRSIPPAVAHSRSFVGANAKEPRSDEIRPQWSRLKGRWRKLMSLRHLTRAAALCLGALLVIGVAGCGQRDTLLTVHASATTRAAPDLAIVTFGVTARGATARTAQQAQAARMTAVLEAARAAGVTDENVQTIGLSLDPQYVYPRNAAPRITGYSSTNIVAVRVENLDAVSSLVDAVVADGANQLQGIQFAFRDDDTARNAARAQAVEAALARASAYAEAADMRVDRIIAISEDGAAPPPMPYDVMARGLAMEQSANTPIRPGQLDAEGGVTVVFALR
jgi:uncharacterized protein